MSRGRNAHGASPLRRCLPVAFWPAEDQRLWALARRRGDPFDPGGQRAGHRPITNTKVEKGYGRWLTFVGSTSEFGALLPAADSITPGQVKAYVEHLRTLGNSSNTVLSRLQELGDMAKALAPTTDWSWIRRIASRVRAQGAPAHDKRARLVPSDALLSLGIDLMDQAATAATTRMAAMAFRDGLMIALLSLRPLRRRNLRELALGRSLIRTAAGWAIRLTADETKTHMDIEWPWPAALCDALETYLAEHRPRLMVCESRWRREIGPALWVSSHGSPMTEMAIYDMIAERTRRAFGHVINPHLFRDSAATTMAIRDPVHVRIAAPLLGHKNFATTERYYQQAQMLSAHRQYSAALSARWPQRRKQTLGNSRRNDRVKATP